MYEPGYRLYGHLLIIKAFVNNSGTWCNGDEKHINKHVDIALEILKDYKPVNTLAKVSLVCEVIDEKEGE